MIEHKFAHSPCWARWLPSGIKALAESSLVGLAQAVVLALAADYLACSSLPYAST